MARAVGGLSTADLDKIRTSLAAGRRPKVVFTRNAGQMAGQTGQVTALNDPADGEWVVTRFGRDELPFAPTDLALAPKAAPAKRVSKASPAAVTVPPAPVAEPAPAPEPKSTPPPVKAVKEAPVPEPTPSAPAAPPKKAPARKAAKGKPVSLTVTLAYADGDWTVAAHHGSRAIAKPTPIRPAEALKMVGLIALPAVKEAEDAVVTAARTEAEQEAERLRAELAEIESRLAELRG